MTEDAGRPAYWNSGRLIKMANTGVTPPNSSDAVSGAGWADIDSEYETDGDGSNKSMNFSNNNEIYSFHPGGCNFLFGDGSVRFLKQTINPGVFVSVISYNRGEVISSDSYLTPPQAVRSEELPFEPASPPVEVPDRLVGCLAFVPSACGDLRKIESPSIRPPAR